MLKVITFAALALACTIVSITAECEIHVTGGLGDPQALLLYPGTTDFYYPQSNDGIIRVEYADVIELFCTSSVNALCLANGNFLIDGTSMPFAAYSCPSLPAHSVRKTNRTCYNGATIVGIGFDLGDGRFPSIAESCHDEIIETNYYVQHKMTYANAEYQHSFPRPGFITGGLFGGKDVNGLYTQVTQKATFATILGSQALADELFSLPDDIYLARGHQAAKADFIFGSQQDATFYFVNVQPQWQSFNGYNWERLESGVRGLFVSRNTELDIYTGTYGVLTFPDVDGIDREMYLHYVPDGVSQIPVPKLYYKLLHEPSTGLGIVIVGVNNPHATLAEIQQSYVICNDVGDQVNWIGWDRQNLKTGYMYACEVNEFMNVVGHLPNLGVTGLFL